MASCTNRVKPKSRVCIGDLDKNVTLVQRDVQSPLYGDTEPNVVFVTIDTSWASIKTIKGLDRLNGVNLDDNPTHIIRMRYRDIDNSYWISYASEYYKPLLIDNIDEDGLFIELVCSKTGDKDNTGSEY